MKITPRKLSLLFCSAALAVPPVGYSAEPGQATQVNAKPATSGHQAAGHHRGPKKIALTIAEDATLMLWKPDLTTLPPETGPWDHYPPKDRRGQLSRHHRGKGPGIIQRGDHSV